VNEMTETDFAKTRLEDIIQIPSHKSNYSSRSLGGKRLEDVITAFIVHDPGFYDLRDKNNDIRLKSISAQRKLEITIDELTLPNKQKSAHYTLDYTGQLYQHVDVIKKAWHAGESHMFGDMYVNNFSIGIEVLEPFTEIEYLVLAELIKDLQKTYYNIKAPRILGHHHISPGRKTDPYNFNFDKLYSYIYK